MAAKNIAFKAEGWGEHRLIRLRDELTLPPGRSIIHLPVNLSVPPDFKLESEWRVVRKINGGLFEIPAQGRNLQIVDGQLQGEVVFAVDDVQPGEQPEFRFYHGNPPAPAPVYSSDLKVSSGSDGPQHYFIENDFYKIETMPQSGQIWHMWNKLGTNTSWHHNEWDSNKDKGGDPCHWAPNCWAAYPERISKGYDVLTGGEDIDLIDWNYAFGWRNPESEMTCGPWFCEFKRQGIVWPHPDHTNPMLHRSPDPFIRAEVVYRFYAGVPWFYQSSVLETLQDMRVFFIRNCQFVFLSNIFSHTFLAPDRTDILPTDEEDVAVLRLMGKIDRKPYTHQQHSFSNVLPAKLAYYGFYNQDNTDGFALFQLAERNSNGNSGEPHYQNHATLFSELPGWSAYYCRSFSYTNQRYNPENATFLPAGERYEEENVCLFFKHTALANTLSQMKTFDQCLKEPMTAELI